MGELPADSELHMRECGCSEAQVADEARRAAGARSVGPGVQRGSGLLGGSEAASRARKGAHGGASRARAEREGRPAAPEPSVRLGPSEEP